MDYQKIYDQIINRALSSDRKKVKGGVYYECHHITPRCLGGSNKKENKVLLTAREHFVCHKLLHFIYPEDKKLWSAYFMMAFVSDRNQERKYEIGSRECERIKLTFSENQRGEKNRNFRKKIGDFRGEGNPMYGKSGELCPAFGIPKTKEQNEKNRLSHLNQESIQCPHCPVKCKPAPYSVWHGDKCRNKVA